ncbi:hypothetical protein MHYP_G00026310 [Metynnis hypsauchen]
MERVNPWWTCFNVAVADELRTAYASLLLPDTLCFSSAPGVEQCDSRGPLSHLSDHHAARPSSGAARIAAPHASLTHDNLHLEPLDLTSVCLHPNYCNKLRPQPGPRAPAPRSYRLTR